MLEKGLAKVYPYTEFNVSIASSVPDLRKGVKNLKIRPWAPDHAPF